ncbi:MAG: Glu/Leu/Phe/Val dehydrogenase [Sphingobacteriaceae bacterium]|nr:MAG: Glu/Leu/Phe/Val dehydrogenase [Pedobacter sp.]
MLSFPLVDNTVFSQLVGFGHQSVLFCYDQETSLRAIIAIHDTTLGPALGGTRMMIYKTEADALRDVLRLSRGMTYKAAITGLNLGGGKAVIIGDSRTDKTEVMMRRYGRFIENLNGLFITATDVGTSQKDMEYIRSETKHVTGVPIEIGGSGNPAPITAIGVYFGIRACAKELFGNDALAGRSVAVQGVGQVGECLVRLLRKENVKVYVSDINEERLIQVAKKYKAEMVSNSDIYNLDVDVYAPCALGSTINTLTINKLKCAIIAGAANNQLADEEEHGKLLLEKDILYAPDYLINAGGLINSYSEIVGYSKERTIQLAENIYEMTRGVLKKSKSESIPTYVAANQIAEKRIADIKKIKTN